MDFTIIYTAISPTGHTIATVHDDFDHAIARAAADLQREYQPVSIDVGSRRWDSEAISHALLVWRAMQEPKEGPALQALRAWRATQELKEGSSLPA